MRPSPTMPLGLLAGTDHPIRPEFADVTVRGMTADSRAVKPGYLFAALRGVSSDGLGFIGDAVARGAAAVLCAADASLESDPGVPVLRAEEPRSENESHPDAMLVSY